MNHTFYRPGPPLERFVDFFWATEAYVAQTPRERVLPSGAQALIVHLEEHPVHVYAGEHASERAEASGAILCGARSSPLIIGTALGPTVGVHFKPGGARPFLDVPADAIADQVVPLDALWGAAGRSLWARLMDGRNTLTLRDRARVLEEVLLARVRHPLEASAALRVSLCAFEEPALASVAEVNRRTGLSPKRLSALFRDEVGLNPKAFWRVRRFRAALRDLDRGALRGAELAYAHGYFDQAHFLREFRAFAGSSPRDYLAARVAGTDHVAVPGKKDPIRRADSRVCSLV